MISLNSLTGRCPAGSKRHEASAAVLRALLTASDITLRRNRYQRMGPGASSSLRHFSPLSNVKKQETAPIR
jgi:hypothetical protein